MIFLAGPCVIESEELCFACADKLKEISEKYQLDFYFKASFDKANRTDINSYRGPGIQQGMSILKKVKEAYSVKIVTDIHEVWQAKIVAEIADIIQIPAFLCRQTDLLLAAANTGKHINIKKAQFMAPWDMGYVIKKVYNINRNIMLTERGSSFGYNNLVVDMTSLVELQKYHLPVLFDATHSVQKPGGLGNSSGGNREYAKKLLLAAAAVGIDGIFMETHPKPEEALSDGPNMIRLSEVENVIQKVLQIDKIIREI